MTLKQSTAKSILTILAFGAFAALPANADSPASRTAQSWVAHADAVFAAADAENLALARDVEARRAWVAHAEAVFAAADAENLAIAQATSERQAWVAYADSVFEAADEENILIALAQR